MQLLQIEERRFIREQVQDKDHQAPDADNPRNNPPNGPDGNPDEDPEDDPDDDGSDEEPDQGGPVNNNAGNN